MGIINYLIHSLTSYYPWTQGNVKQTTHLKQQKRICFGNIQNIFNSFKSLSSGMTNPIKIERPCIWKQHRLGVRET
jgi:hypothetical protein